MATRKNELEEERMTDANLEKVIEMLAPAEGKPWTKKEACQFLGMTYNTTRLGNILEKFKERKEKDAVRRAEKRGKPASSEEITFSIGEYLDGATIDSISKAIYRSPAFVKRIIEENHVPIRQAGHSYFRPELIPEAACRDKFAINEIVYSARYDTKAKIISEGKSKEHGIYYKIWLLGEKHLQYANQPAYELASLEHLRVLGVPV
ncbi:MAG: hypothetical protein KDC82_04700 [Bacteroidetes bacterium]|nr:hypothetical protein [Bacteroidota bacterium]